MAEIDDTGYRLYPQNEWFRRERDAYLGIDPDWNLDPSSPDGLKLAIDAETLGNLDEVLQRAYNSKDPNKAKGVDLDTICALTFTYRDQGSPSTVGLMLTGVPGTYISAGRVVENTLNGSRWKTNNAVTIAVNGTVTVMATCTVNGRTEAAIGSITKIIDTVAGWTGVTNGAVATLGTAVQSNESLRRERELTVARPGLNQVENILSEVYAVPGVRHARVYENDEKTPDINNQPGNSVAVVVDGGDDEEVAKAIALKRSTGVTQHQPGTAVTKDVASDKFPWQVSTIKYSRPTYIDVEIVATVINDGTLPPSAESEIKASIYDYVTANELDEGVGFNVLGFSISEDVHPSRLYTPVNKVIGAYGNSFVQSITLNGGVGAVTIAYDEIARFAESKISVVINNA